MTTKPVTEHSIDLTPDPLTYIAQLEMVFSYSESEESKRWAWNELCKFRSALVRTVKKQQ